ncbi:transglycosylase SLT domain-containing protein [Clostridium sp.]|uniref:lytic transglycosylase domain-containing protein n=1 Tax=Clostridium sp. TaxID=1506 RepID=UPI002FC92DBF
MSYNNVSMNNINTYNNINNKTNKVSTNNPTVANSTQGTTSSNMLEALGLGNLGLDSMLGTENGQGTEGLAQMLQMGMLSKVFGGGEDSSGSEGFQMVLGALVKALNDKQQGNKIGIDSNNQFDGVHINDLVLRSLNNTAVSAVNTNKTEGERIELAIKEASKKHGVDEELIRAIIKVESDFNPKVKSSAGAMGLMQLMPENVKYYGVKDPYNIEENIDAGTRHIKDYLKMHNNDLDMALAAYNFGPGNMRKRGITGEEHFYKLPTETKNYLVKIRKYYNP